MPHEGEGLLAALLQQPFAWRIVRLTRTGHCLRLGRYQSTSTQAFRSTILSREKKHRTTCTLYIASPLRIAENYVHYSLVGRSLEVLSHAGPPQSWFYTGGEDIYVPTISLLTDTYEACTRYSTWGQR